MSVPTIKTTDGIRGGKITLELDKDEIVMNYQETIETAHALIRFSEYIKPERMKHDFSK